MHALLLGALLAGAAAPSGRRLFTSGAAATTGFGFRALGGVRAARAETISVDSRARARSKYGKRLLRLRDKLRHSQDATGVNELVDEDAAAMTLLISGAYGQRAPLAADLRLKQERVLQAAARNDADSTFTALDDFLRLAEFETDNSDELQDSAEDNTVDEAVQSLEKAVGAGAGGVTRLVPGSALLGTALVIGGLVGSRAFLGGLDERLSEAGGDSQLFPKLDESEPEALRARTEASSTQPRPAPPPSPPPPPPGAEFRPIVERAREKKAYDQLESGSIQLVNAPPKRRRRGRARTTHPPMDLIDMDH